MTASRDISEYQGSLYVVRIAGVDPDFASLPLGRQGEAQLAIRQWKETAKRDWIIAKTRKGQHLKTELRKWIASVKPAEVYAKLDPNDDSHEVFYKP